MRFLVLAVALFLEKTFSLSQWRKRFFVNSLYLRRAETVFSKYAFYRGYIGVLCLVVPAAVVVLLLEILIFRNLHGLLLPIFNLLVVMYCLEGCDFRCQYSLDTQMEKSQYQFTLIFWFMLLGAFGAVFARLLQTLSEEGDHRLREAANRLYAYLAWVPSRLLSLSFALVGNFSEVLNRWAADAKSAGNHELLCASASLAMNEQYETVKLSQLVNRALLIWLAVYAILILI
ncbi:MAG: hypothetical protein COV52_08950 [Gammaproteobacteria bacterium CG11_big_fil_rev_8_21_14_0_20_46_22]|nr:MAG: hypothetical protein COW05_01565 [Gammaproteobacteria bacterium CG12_big_fil_rev_8_21_14_0_65_46_12]PIR10405.1 MAG: hypothetical protein COV52_08950 [Gammaproteobacteria bacterium CG11_big_fil_rev_8_21_14_0_20_46_22]